MSVAEAQAALKVLEDEVVALRKRKETLSAELQAVDHRLHQLTGGWSGTGELANARAKVTQAQREEQDAAARLVIWEVEPYSHSNTKPYIVVKITPKRIYVRPQGVSRAQYYNRDGLSESSWEKSKIDVAATFPEGLAEYEKAHKRKK